MHLSQFFPLLLLVGTRSQSYQAAGPPAMNWFEDIFGFPEKGGYDNVRSNFRVLENAEGGPVLVAVMPDGSGTREFRVGKFDTPTLAELRGPLTTASGGGDGGIVFEHIVASVDQLHLDPSNAGAVFQAASQFNCLEMVNPNVKPEEGVTGYALDHTQGPVCALSCPAGTVYRNYFVNGHGQGGEGKQLDMLEDFGIVVGNKNSSAPKGFNYWRMKNGYALPVGNKSIRELAAKLRSNEAQSREAMESLRVGVHWDTEVVRSTQGDNEVSPHRVAQVYCSALPIAYDYTASASDWEPFAQLVLNGLYQATLAVGSILAQQRGERVSVFLTMVGGGAFGNQPEWISRAIQRSLLEFKDQPLDVHLVHYGRLEAHYVDNIRSVGKDESAAEL